MKTKKPKWYEVEEQKSPRHHEDSQLRGEVSAMLAELGPDHPAVSAFNEGASTVEACHLIDLEANKELVERINAAYVAWGDRFRNGTPKYFSPWKGNDQ